MSEIGETVPQPELGQEVVLPVELDCRTGFLGDGYQRGEIDVSSDIGLPRLVERVRTQMVRPIGPERAVLTPRDQVLGGVPVIEEEDRAGLETVQHFPQPG